MHFVEGLMSMWKDKEIEDNVWRSDKSTTKYSKNTFPGQFQNLIALSRKQFPYLLISYRDKAFPSKQEIKGYLNENYQISL